MDKVSMVPGFILKLWKMINDPQCDDLISWSENGQSFIIIDPPRFSQELSKYFKHNNLSSFIRQLNMYGFRKVATIENSGLHPGTEDLHFYHSDFLRDQPEKLEAIKRKLPQKLAESVDLRNVIKGITDIEDKQKNVTQTLSEIKRENEMLWAELHDLRQKHQQQQLYISRLMKLVFEAMEQNGIKTNVLQLTRNSPLMIEQPPNLETEMEAGESSYQVDPTLSPDQSNRLNEQMVATTALFQPSVDQAQLIDTNMDATAEPFQVHLQPTTIEPTTEAQINPSEAVTADTATSEAYRTTPQPPVEQPLNAESRMDTEAPSSFLGQSSIDTPQLDLFETDLDIDNLGTYFNWNQQM